MRKDTLMSFLRKSVYVLGLCSFLCFANLVNAQTPSAPSAKTPAKAPGQAPAKVAAIPAALVIPQLNFEKYKLENGLEVIFSEDHRMPIGAVNLWYHSA